MKITNSVFKNPKFQQVINTLITKQDELFNIRHDKLTKVDNSNVEKIQEICRTDINKNIRDELDGYLHLLDLKTKCNGIKFNEVFYIPESNKNERLNCSNPSTDVIMFNSIKFQTICYYKELVGMSKQEVIPLMCIMFAKLMNKINNGMTYNSNGNITYTPYTSNRIITICNQVYKTVFEIRDFTVLRSSLGIEENLETYINSLEDNKLIYNGCLKVSRFKKEEMEKYINECTKSYNRVPKYEELTEFIITDIITKCDKIDASIFKNLPNDNVIRYYVKKYGLEDRMFFKKRVSRKKK